MYCSLKRAASSRPAVGVCLTLLMLVGHIPLGHAALTLSATRVVFDSNKRSVSLVVSNPSKQTFAVQTWVNTTDDDTTTPVPFMASPPLFRLNSGKDQQVQINGLPNTLPTDRESLFFFNVQEIPQAQAADSNVLNIALRTRIKLFYRPTELKDNPISRLQDLQWSIQQVKGQSKLVVNNPTPFHVTFARIELSGNGQQESPSTPGMSRPMTRMEMPLKTFKPTGAMQVRFSAINDYGGASALLDRPVEIAP